jgi:hypothetical protein
MSESALRQALGSAITVSIIGIVALAAGGFFAPIPASNADGSLVVTAYVTRTILVIISLAISLVIAYRLGYRIGAADNSDDRALPTPDPSASSQIVTLLNTPGSRRDGFLGGGVVMFAYWIITTLYLIAFGKFLDIVPITPATASSTIGQRLLLGIVLVAAGLGLGALGARAALARKMTNAALGVTIAASPPLPNVSAQAEPSSANATSESAPWPSDVEQAPQE